jgi:HAD superfamily hydrolase (TIGR01549 family)
MKLIMFDYDGVIVDSFQFLKKVYRKIASVMGEDFPEDDAYFKELIELDWNETYRKLDILAKDKVNIAEYIFHLENHKNKDLIYPYPDIPFVIKELSKRYKLAIITNNFRKEIEYRLNKFLLREYFSAIYTCEDGELKPSPDLINKCLKEFNVLPKDAAFIGDMDGDIKSAKAANLKMAVAVTYGYHTKHRLKDADKIISSPRELLTLFP